MNDMSIGQIVRSKAGRDQGRVFVVVANSDDSHVMIADGDLRKIEKPKKKKIKHLQKINKIAEDVRNKIINNERITNEDLKNALEQFRS
ncbi:MAG: RNA-binding protein [Thermoanaerobacteraceae bacterium]